MMSLEQTIKHFDESEKINKNVAEHCVSVLAKNHSLENAEKCRQLAAWLRELQERRKEPEIVTCYECEHSRVWGCELYCTKWMRYTSHKGYCHRGAERRTE